MRRKCFGVLSCLKPRHHSFSTGSSYKVTHVFSDSYTIARRRQYRWRIHGWKCLGPQRAFLFRMVEYGIDLFRLGTLI